MQKYYNPRLHNAVVAGTGMEHPRRPHVVLGSELNGYVQGDLVDANGICDLIHEKNVDTFAKLEALETSLKNESKARAEDMDNLSEQIDRTIAEKLGSTETVYGESVQRAAEDERLQSQINDLNAAIQEHQDISGKADKTAVDAALATKADKSTTYTKEEVDNLIDGVDVSEQLEDYYTEDETDAALAGKQDTIDDLSTIRSGAAAGATAVQPAALTPIENDIAAIEGKIPSEASTSNQLADKAFVSSALADKADAADIPTTLSQLSQDSTHRTVTDSEKSTWDGKQNAISTVNVSVDNNTGTPSGSASVSGSTLSLSFQNIKGATGATGATGPQGPQGERGLPGESGVTGDVSGFTVIQTIDPSATYGATDIAGAATVQATNAELTELGGYMEEDVDVVLKYLGTYVLDTSTGDLVSNTNYKCYEGNIEGLKSLKTTSNKSSHSRGQFAFYDDSDNLVGTVFTTAGTDLAREIVDGATKFKLSTYTAEAKASGTKILSANEINEKFQRETYNREINLTYIGSYTIDLVTGELVSNSNFSCYEASVANCKSVYTTNNVGNSARGVFALYDSSDNLVGTVSTVAGTNLKRGVIEGASKFKMATYTTTAKASGDFTFGDAAMHISAISKIGGESINNSIGETLIRTSYSTNLININDFLYGYSLISGNFRTKNTGVFSNKIYANKGEHLVCKGIKPFQSYNSNYVAYFDSNDNFLFRTEESFQDTTEQICSFVTSSSNEWSYLRILIRDNNLGNGGLTTPICSIGQLPSEYEDYVPILSFKELKPKYHVPHVLLTGASFAYDANDWFDVMLGMVGAKGTNKAVSGTSIKDLAKNMWNGNLYTSSTLDSYDVLMIMHVHNYNVADTNVIKANYTDYTYEEISGNYTQAYDYVIRKWQADCYNQKDNESSKWYGSKYGKPAMIVLCTHWHNGRPVYNNSIKVLAEKFALPLVDWASQIGVSSTVNNPVTGSNATIYYAQDTDDSKGWHPLRDANPNGTIQWLQVRMAAIAANVLKPICDSFLYID